MDMGHEKIRVRDPDLERLHLQMHEANRRGDHELADTTLFALARYLAGRADLSALEANIATAALDWYAHLAKTYE
jgi:hypothetical protein